MAYKAWRTAVYSPILHKFGEGNSIFKHLPPPLHINKVFQVVYGQNLTNTMINLQKKQVHTVNLIKAIDKEVKKINKPTEK